MALTIIERPSPNCGSRHGAAIDCLVIHDTECATAAAALSWFESPDSKVSAHYVIDRGGTVYRCVAEEARAWHAGPSVIDGRADVNTYSIGIEMVGFATGDYTAEQIDVLVGLATGLCLKYKIPVERIVGHENIAVPPGRKTDPGPYFPWTDVRGRITVALATSVT